MRSSFKKLICVAAAVAVGAFACGCSAVNASPDIKPHLISAPDENHTVKAATWQRQRMSDVDGELTDVQYRARVDELYSLVVYDNKYPIFAENDPVERVFDAATEILDKYILSEWQSGGDDKIVHAIHDYLAYTTDYDFALYNSYQAGNTDLANDPAFYIDGVLLENKAVCDGIARTFDFLCALEGIESMRVTGSFASVPHAWNKVRLDGAWYNIDVTADCANYNIDGKTYKQISHGYYLLSDDTIGGFKPNSHVFSTQPVTADRDYDFFGVENAELKIDGRSYPTVVTTAAELNRIFSAVSGAKGKIGKLELRLDFAGKTQVNAADMYEGEIAAAYSKVKNCSFSLASGTKPYFRYPNGVYLFLIYK